MKKRNDQESVVPYSKERAFNGIDIDKVHWKNAPQIKGDETDEQIDELAKKLARNQYNEWVKARIAFLGEHHVWCNFFLDEPAETCSMCSGMKKNYPQGDKSCDELMKEHFPNNVRIG